MTLVSSLGTLFFNAFIKLINSLEIFFITSNVYKIIKTDNQSKGGYLGS